MSKTFLDDDDVDLADLGFQDNGDYIPDRKKGWTTRASERDIAAVKVALQEMQEKETTLPDVMAGDLRTTAAAAANSLGLFSERTLWPSSTTLAFLSRLYPKDFEALLDGAGGEESLADFFKASLRETFPRGQQLTPIEMLIGLMRFEAAVASHICEGVSYIPQPKDFMDIPYLTLKQYSRAVPVAEVVRRIKAANATTT